MMDIMHTIMAISRSLHSMQPVSHHKKQVDQSVLDILLKKEVIVNFSSASDLVRKTD